MASTHRETPSSVGGRHAGRLALFTLIAAVSSAPWISSSGAPWAVFALRLAGFAGLALVSYQAARGRIEANVWSVRAVLLAIAVVILAAASAVGSVHQGKSLEAMLNLLAILGLFLATALFVRGSGDARLLVSAQILSAIPVALFGILQHYRPELVPAGSSYPGRALGPFGQPNRLGGYLIAAIPLAITLSFVVQDRIVRGALLASALTLALCLVLTYSRGAWIALAVSAVALAAAFVRWPELSPRPLLIGAALAALLVPALLLLPSIVSRVTSQPGREAAWNLPFDPEREGSGAMRGAVWQGALAAASAKPLLGWGIGAFREAFDRSKGATMKRLEAEGGRTADQAHGYYLAALVERGAPGVLTFVLFAVFGLAAGAAIVGSGAPAEARLIAAGLVASVTALLAHAVLEDNLVLAPHALLLHANIGLLAAAAPGPRAARRGLFAVGAAGALVALVGAGIGVQSARAESLALDAARNGGARSAQAGYAAASRTAPWDERYALGEAKACEALSEYFRAETAYRRAVALNPSDPVSKHELARLYLAHEERFGVRGRTEATALLRGALDQNPYYAEIRNDLGVALLRAGDREGALRAFREAAGGRETFVDPLVNLAAIALEDGDREAAASWIRRALERNPDSARALAMASSLGVTGAK